MKAKLVRPIFRLSRSQRRRAAALIIVLAFLVLLTGLILAFFSSATTELATSITYASGFNARALGDSAVQIVQAQILAGTASRDSSGKAQLWASQPGMIRTWMQSGGPGPLYKLYSSKQMEVPGVTFKMSDEVPPADWAAQPSRYVDLNSPVIVADPSGSIVVDGVNSRASYPVMDPAAVGRVDGFELMSVPGTYTGGYPPSPAYNPVLQPNPAPMPLEWMYLLANGTITMGTSYAGSMITSFSVAPTKDNPITARIAFWADDETAKINVNTASEGTFWEVPRDTTSASWSFVRSIPVQNEFQRSPGHPSGVSLSPVLGSSQLLPRNNAGKLSASATAGWANFNVSAAQPLWSWPNSATDSPLYPAYTELKPYYDLNPRVSYFTHNQAAPSDTTTKYESSSRAGTQWNTTSNAVDAPVQNWPTPIVLKSSRLYATLDEFYFKDDYVSGKRIPNKLSSDTTYDAAVDVSRFRFFLTANGRADETTPFNTPKVAVWPMAAETNLRSVKEALISQAASEGIPTASSTTPYPYYFTRLVTNNLTSSTSAGKATQSCASNSADYSGRNVTLYHYLQKLTDDGGAGFGAIPGFGGNFSGKWSPAGRDRVLTQAFDLIRGLVNVNGVDTANSLPAAGGGNINPQASFRDPSPGALTAPGGKTLFPYGTNYVVPIEIDGGNGPTRGFGRFLTFDEMTFVFMRYDDPTDPAPTNKKQKMRVLVYFQPFQPSPSLALSPGCRLRVEGLGGLQVALTTNAGATTNMPLNFTDATVRFNSRVQNPFPFIGYNALTTYNTDEGNGGNRVRALGKTNEDLQYPFYSDEIDVTPYTTFKLKGGVSATLTLLEALNGTTLQQMSMSVPDTGVMPLPNGTKPWEQRLAVDGNAGGFSNGIMEGDITRSIVFDANNVQTGGDLRMLLLTKTVPASWFIPHPRYFDSISPPVSMKATDVPGDPTKYRDGHYAHSLRSGVNAVEYGNLADKPYWSSKLSSAVTVGVLPNGAPNANGGQSDVANPGGLVPSITLSQSSQPTAPVSQAAWVPRISGATGLLGDWSSGMGMYDDGAVLMPVDYPSVGHNHWGGYMGGGAPGLDFGGLFEPSRLIPNPVVFGNLLTPDSSGNLQGWQTLLFNPVPLADSARYGTAFPSNNHYGAKNPPDYLFLDFFWMPVVEPFALSESFSTAGRVNPNYQIAPFSYIHRSTGLRAAMKSIQLPATPSNPNLYPPAGLQQAPSPTTAQAVDYKRRDGDPLAPGNVMSVKNYFDLNMSRTNGTIKVFEDYFASGDRVLRTAAETCALPLVPSGTAIVEATPPYASLTTFWNDHRLTSDTLREVPYKHLYSRLTTKSNTYTVHFRVQSLKQNPVSAGAGHWDESTDSVVAEYRGSTTIERYVDPSQTIPDYATVGASGPPLSDYYRFRTVANRQFIP